MAEELDTNLPIDETIDQEVVTPDVQPVEDVFRRALDTTTFPDDFVPKKYNYLPSNKKWASQYLDKKITYRSSDKNKEIPISGKEFLRKHKDIDFNLIENDPDNVPEDMANNFLNLLAPYNDDIQKGLSEYEKDGTSPTFDKLYELNPILFKQLSTFQLTSESRPKPSKPEEQRWVGVTEGTPPRSDIEVKSADFRDYLPQEGLYAFQSLIKDLKEKRANRVFTKVTPEIPFLQIISNADITEGEVIKEYGPKALEALKFWGINVKKDDVTSEDWMKFQSLSGNAEEMTWDPVTGQQIPVSQDPFKYFKSTTSEKKYKFNFDKNVWEYNTQEIINPNEDGFGIVEDVWVTETDPLTVFKLNTKNKLNASTSETAEVFPDQDGNQYTLDADNNQWKKLNKNGKFEYVLDDKTIRALNNEYNRQGNYIGDNKQRKQIIQDNNNALEYYINKVNSIGSKEEINSVGYGKRFNSYLELLNNKFNEFGVVFTRGDKSLVGNIPVVGTITDVLGITDQTFSVKIKRGGKIINQKQFSEEDPDLYQKIKDFLIINDQHAVDLEMDYRSKTYNAIGKIKQENKLKEESSKYPYEISNANIGETLSGQTNVLRQQMAIREEEFIADRASNAPEVVQARDRYLRDIGVRAVEAADNPNKITSLVRNAPKLTKDIARKVNDQASEINAFNEKQRQFSQEINEYNSYASFLDNAKKQIQSLEAQLKNNQISLEYYNNQREKIISDGNSRYSKFTPEYIDQLKQQANNLNEEQRQLNLKSQQIKSLSGVIDRAVAINLEWEKERGSFLGGLTYSALSGIGQGLRVISGQSKKDVEQTVKLIIGDETTRSYIDNTNMLYRGIFSVVESGAAMGTGTAVGALAGLPTFGAYAALYSMSYYEMKDELDQIKGMSDGEKLLLSGIYGVVGSALEKVGLDAIFKGTGKSYVKNLVLKNILQNIPKGASKEIIDGVIKSEVNFFATEVLPQMAKSGFSEGTTEGLQYLSQEGIKYLDDAYNEAKGKDFFKDKTAWQYLTETAENFALGAIGGAVVNAASQSSEIVNAQVKLSENKELFSQIEAASRMENFDPLLVSKLKIEIINGKYTKPQAQDIIDNWKKVSQKIKSMPDNMPIDQKAEVFDLMTEKEVIGKEISGKDPLLTLPQQARIKEIDEQIKTIGNAVQEPSTEGVLQRQQEGVTETGGERGGVEPIVQGQEVAKEGEATAETKAEEVVPVYHGGDLTQQEGNLYVSEDVNQARVYANENKGDVTKFEIPKSKIADEQTVKETLKENGVEISDEVRLYEAIDPRFEDTYIGDEAKNNLINTLQEKGFDAVQFRDEDITGLEKEGVQNIVVFKPESLQQKSIEVKQSRADELFADGYKPIIDGEVKTEFTQQELNDYFDNNQTIEMTSAPTQVAQEVTITPETSQTVTERINKETDTKRKKVFTAVQKVLSAIPNAKVILHDNTDAFVSGVAKSAGITNDEAIAQGVNNNRGSYVNGEIHINLEKAGVSTVFHEAFHDLLAKKGMENNALLDMAKGLKSVISDKALKQRLDEFVSNYEEGDRAEEYTTELGAIMSKAQKELSTTKLQRFKTLVNKIAKKLGLPVVFSAASTAQDAVDFMNSMAGKLAKGEQIDEVEPGDGGEVGTFNIPKIKADKSRSVSEDTRDFIRKFVEDIDIREFNGKKFITNMYDYTNAGETDLGNGLSIFMLGGKNYVPLMMELNGKKIGDVSNLAAFNTKEQAETFIRNSELGGANLFAPHAGTLKQSWQFQQHTFAELFNLVLDNGILKPKELIAVFNDTIKDNKSNKNQFKQFAEKYGENIKNFNSFESDPKKIIDLLDIKNNYSPKLRKALNNAIAANKKFQKAIGINNMNEFYKRIMDPLNEGMTGGEIMNIVEFDPTTFEIVETKPNNTDHHPSFGFTLLAKINGIYQPTELIKSVDITDSYTKYNKGGEEVSRKTDEPKFEEKNVSSSAGAIPKTAEFNPKKIKAQIIGKNANLSQNVRDNLKVARDMEVAGKSVKDIRIDTGWERGADGKWRYEISDGRITRKIPRKPTLFQVKDIYEGELLNAYPEIGEMWFKASINPANKLIFLTDGTTYFDENMEFIIGEIEAGMERKLLSILEHELQHIVQTKEGFATGGSPFILSDKKTFLGKLFDFKAQKKYKSLAGEVEARNVQRRMGMTPEQRRMTTLQETEDVAREDQIIFFGEEGIPSKIKAQKNIVLKNKGLSNNSIETIEQNYQDSFGLYDFDWNKESKRNNFKEWLNNFESNQFDKNLSRVINLVKQDIDLLNERKIIEEKLKAFEQLIIPAIGDDVLTKKLSLFEQQILMDPNATIESIEKGFKEAKNIFDKYGNIDKLKITPSNLFEGEEINLPAFEKFVEKNPEYKNVFDDWKKIFDRDIELTSKETNAFSYNINIEKLENLYNELNNIQSKSKIKAQKENTRQNAIDDAKAKYDLSVTRRRNPHQQGVDAALNDLRKSDWYKSSDDTQRENAERELKKFFGEKLKSAPSVEKVLGKKPQPATFSVSDLGKALRDQLKNAAKIAREAKKAIYDSRKSLNESVKEVLRSYKGKISLAQARAILSKSNTLNLLSPEKINQFINYVERVAQNANYAEKVNKAEQTKGKIRRNLKNAQAENKMLAKNFLKIDPLMVEDIDDYNSMADSILGSIAPSRIVKGKPQLKTPVEIASLNDNINYMLYKQEESMKKSMMSSYRDLVDYGVISGDMTYAEMQDVINKIKQDVFVEGYNEDDVNNLLDSMFNDKVIEISEMGATDPNGIISRIQKANIDGMSIKDKAKLVEMLDNFLVNFAVGGLDSVLEVIEGNNQAKNIYNSGKKARPIKYFFSKTLGNLRSIGLVTAPEMFNLVFNGVVAGTKVMDRAGFGKVILGANKARNTKNALENEYAEKFGKQKNFWNIDNTIERGMVAFLARFDKQENMQSELNRRVEMINSAIETLKKGTKEEQKLAKTYQLVADRLNINSVDRETIFNNAKTMNKDAVGWMMDKWADIYGDLSFVSLSVYNTMLSKDQYYTTDRYKKTEMASSITGAEEIPISRSSYVMNSDTLINKTETGVLMPNTKPSPSTIKSQGRYIDLSFEMNNFSAMEGALVDIETAAAIRRVDAFMNSKYLSKVITDPKDLDIIKGKVSKYIASIKNRSVVSNKQYQKVLRDIQKKIGLNFLGKVGYSLGLGSAFQPIQQTVPVTLNTAIQAGPTSFIDLFRTDSKFQQWLNKSGAGVSNRGQESVTAIESADSKIKTFENYTDKISDEVSKFFNLKLKYLLSKPDIWVARGAFLSYYKQYLEMNNIDSSKINWDTWDQEIKDNKLEDINNEAILYADIMVNRNQNVSDERLAGELLSSQDEVMKIIRKTLFPYASFSINSRAKIATDVATIYNWKRVSSEDRSIALKSLIGTLVEQAAFHGLNLGRLFLLGTIASLIYGDDDDETEEEREKRKKNASKFPVKSFMGDLVSPAPILDEILVNVFDMFSDDLSVTEKEVNDAVNKENERRALNYIGNAESKFKMNPEEERKFREKYLRDHSYKLGTDYPGAKDSDRWGLFSVAYDEWKRFVDRYDMAVTGEYIVTDQFGNTTKKYLGDQDKNLVKLVYFIGDLPAMIGGSFKEGSQISNKIYRKIEENSYTYEQYGVYKEFKKRYKREPQAWESMLIRENINFLPTEQSKKSITEVVDYIKDLGGFTNKEGKEFVKALGKITESYDWNQYYKMIKSGKKYEDLLNYSLKIRKEAIKKQEEEDRKLKQLEMEQQKAMENFVPPPL